MAPSSLDYRSTASPTSDLAALDQPTTSIPASLKSNKMIRSRRNLGLLLLALVIFLWTATSFLASAILADHSFSNPFFVTYVNTLFFIIPLPPALAWKIYCEPEWWGEWVEECRSWARWGGERYKRAPGDGAGMRDSLLGGAREGDGLPSRGRRRRRSVSSERTTSSYDSRSHQLSLSATAKLSLEFCLLWFAAGYFLLVCLQYTTVASSTILTSTSSAFTLIFGALLGVEIFTLRKLLSVCLCLVGVFLISSVDFSGTSSDDEHRGLFPEKTMRELALGNILALLSAIIYALYIVRMKQRIPSSSTISMPIFFGFVGLANALLLWPGFFILHYTGLEPFEFPAAGRVTTILLANAAGSMLSDVLWAYAVVLTSPILVTVGLSLTIPLTLVGQMVLNGQRSSLLYWIGAGVVVGSFVIVCKEGEQEAVKEEGVGLREERGMGR